MQNSNPDFNNTLKDPQILANLISSHLNGLIKFATLIINGTFLLNSAVGVVAFKEYEYSNYPLLLSIIGALFSVVTAILAYFLQSIYMNIDLIQCQILFADEKTKINLQQNFVSCKKKSNIFYYLCALSACFSLACFIVGGWIVFLR